MKKTSLDSLNLPLKISICFAVYLFFFVFTQKLYVQAKSYIEHNFIDAKSIIIANTSIKAKISDSEIKRIKGLSNTERLDENEGMLFIFEDEDFHGIWMKDMNYPIDIIWFDKDKKIIDYAVNVSPETYPTIFKPKEKALYVLEVKAGFLDEHNLKKGDYLAI